EPSRLEDYARRLIAPLPSPRWMRLWLAWEGSALVGHLDLVGGMLLSEQHRCTLGMGLHHDHRRRGLGSALLESAVAWARAAPGLCWIDLGVFGGNAPAQALYHKFGFVERGRTVDRFRVSGVSIDNIDMALRLK